MTSVAGSRCNGGCAPEAPPAIVFAQLFIINHAGRGPAHTASVVLGGVAPMPWRLPEVAQWLRGQALSAPVAGQAGALAIAHAQPLAKHGHKVPMTSAAVERALLRLVR